MNKKYIIIAPCFNEEIVIENFLRDLENKLHKVNSSFIVLIVDDGSTDSTVSLLGNFKFDSIQFELKVIQLFYNMGHQEAIRQGLIFSQNINIKVDGIIVMDSDGEDDPNAILEIIKNDNFDIIFIERGKRKDNIYFKFGYFFYKILFYLVTGNKISFGNFSAISPKVLKSISQQKFFHFAGFLAKQKFRIDKIQFDRQSRLDGKSKMNYRNLVFHGLFSLVEYSEEILFFLIKIFISILIVLSCLGCYVFYSKFISNTAIYGWSSTIIFNLIIASLVIVSTIILGLLLLSIKKSINQRNGRYHEIK